MAGDDCHLYAYSKVLWAAQGLGVDTPRGGFGIWCSDHRLGPPLPARQGRPVERPRTRSFGYYMTAMTSDTPFDTASGKNRGTENFPVGSALIRPDLRKHVHAFYNFARAADDISDHPLLDAKEKVRLLDKFALCLADDRNTAS
jgi:hypothetical protein